MDPNQKIQFLENEIKELKQLQKEMEFRQDLIFFNTAINRILYEYKITKEQYDKIMDLMDLYREKIGNKQKVSHETFEQQVYNIVTQHDGNYHLVEFLTMAFKEENRWGEVFDALYGDLPKFKNNLEEKS
ncbi:DUF1878 domain-containing protein [Psychrobacillus sp. FJAT-51614]|uniref:DUF1878 domain-containing protein n=1 Tax=Psychrobacillus mangrovi TaxID=3117745 RepID=A0ABU8F662_9BACI